MQTGFIPVFEEKFKRLMKEIEKQYQLPKSERNKELMKRNSQEAKKLRKLFRECKVEIKKCCPNCGCDID